jgi:hypothetical protein
MSEQVKIWCGAAVVVIGTMVGLFRWWTYPPAVEFDNLKYIQLLSTAVSARNAEWVEKVAMAVEQRHADGQMSAGELQHFQTLIDQARRGEWEAADRACFKFAEAQLSRRRSRPATDDAHQHRHDGGASVAATSAATVVRSH